MRGLQNSVLRSSRSTFPSLFKEGAEKTEELRWLLVFALTLFSLNFLGASLRDALTRGPPKIEVESPGLRGF